MSEESLARDVRLGGLWTAGQRRKNDAIFALVSAALDLSPRLPRGLTGLATRLLADAVWLLWGEGRRRTARNLALAFPGGDGPRSREVFRGLGRALADTVALLGGGPATGEGLAIAARDVRVFTDALSEGRGVVLATAHLGPWERMAAVLVEAGLPLATVARESYDPRFDDRVYARLRAARGVRALYRGSPGFALRLVRALRSGMVVGFPMDLGGRGVRTLEVPWLGGRLPLALGPAELSLRSGAPVVVSTTAPGEGGALRVTAERIQVPAGTGPADAAERLTLAIGASLERRVRNSPTAWPFMHREHGNGPPPGAR